MAEIAITIRTSEQNADQLTAYAGSKSGGAIRATEGFLAIRKYALHEIKGVFTRDELTAIVDAQNGTMLVPEYQANKGVFLAHLEDSELLEGSFTRHGASWSDARAKIEGLNSAQVFFLQDEVDLFWNRDNGADLNGFLDKYAV